MMLVLFWILFGAIVGWIAAILEDEKTLSRLAVALILTGALGGLIGGLCGYTFSHDIALYDAPIGGIMFAVYGAVGLLAIARAAADHHS